MKMESLQTRFVLMLSIFATSFATGAFLLAWAPSNDFFNASPSNDGYVAPRDISQVIDVVQESTVTVMCKRVEKMNIFGTGWTLDANLLQEPTSRTTVVTNHHVIKKCLDGGGEIFIAKQYKRFEPAEVHVIDKINDLAVLETDVKLPNLKLSKSAPWPGYWVMALGSAGTYEGSVAIGNVLNVTEKDILITNNISEGNSGGPLVDNEGKVLGTVTWGMDYRKDQYSGARILDVFCLTIIKCANKFRDEATWFEYIE